MSLKIDIWSDIACPWCFVGKRRLEKALADYDDSVDIEYHSYELSPDTPVDFDGSEAEFLATHKHIPRDQAEAMLGQMTQLAATEGLSYDFANLKHTNTRLAHQALHYAKSVGKQTDFKERLLKAYFEEGRHVGRIDELADLGAEIGLDRDQLVSALASDDFASAVDEDINQAVEYGIGGVPFFVFNGKVAVSGAQDPTVFTQAIARAEDAA